MPNTLVSFRCPPTWSSSEELESLRLTTLPIEFRLTRAELAYRKIFVCVADYLKFPKDNKRQQWVERLAKDATDLGRGKAHELMSSALDDLPQDRNPTSVHLAFIRAGAPTSTAEGPDQSRDRRDDPAIEAHLRFASVFGLYHSVVDVEFVVDGIDLFFMLHIMPGHYLIGPRISNFAIELVSASKLVTWTCPRFDSFLAGLKEVWTGDSPEESFENELRSRKWRSRPAALEL